MTSKKCENDYNFTHSCNTKQGSSGSPILSKMSRKILGIHNCYRVNGKKIYNQGNFINYPINEFNGSDKEKKITIKLLDPNKFVKRNNIQSSKSQPKNNNKIENNNAIYSNTSINNNLHDINTNINENKGDIKNDIRITRIYGNNSKNKEIKNNNKKVYLPNINQNNNAVKNIDMHLS